MARIFLVDDHSLVRDGVRALLADEPGMVVVGEACHGQELLDQLPTTPADVVLLDINMPVLDGQATTRRLHAEYPNLKILVLSMLSHERYVEQLFEAGAHGYVLKNADKEEIVVAIRSVLAGRQFLCSDLGLAMLRKVMAKEPATHEEYDTKKPSHLTRRETEILRLLSEGLTTSEMAEKLFTSKRTIETHRQNILEKTQTKNTAALIKLAMIQGLLN
ncbi:MAG: response regulator transcription factor [Hymenobacter sp.]|nr:MAG: response regulator transcription factor [Hymenobacter sp.]